MPNNRSEKLQLHYYKKMFLMVVGISPKSAAINAFVILVQSGVIMGQLFFMKKIVDALSHSSVYSFQYIVYITIMLCVLYLLPSLLTQLNNHINLIYNQKITDKVSGMVLNKATKVDYMYYEDHSYYDMLHRAQQHALYRSGQFLHIILSVLQQGTLSISLLIVLLYYDWKLAVAVFMLATPISLVNIFFTKKQNDLERELTPKERESYYLQNVLSTKQYAKEIRLYDFGKLYFKRFRDIRDFIFKKRVFLNSRQNKFVLLINLLELITTIFIFLFLVKKTWTGAITLGLFVIYMQGIQRLQSSLQAFFNAMVSLYQQRLHWQNLFTYLDIKEPEETEKPEFPASLEKIEVSNLSFSYSTDYPLVLKGITFSANKGEFVAIVGENGSGKSTLAHILANLYRSNQGTINFNGNNISSINSDSFTKNVSVLLQDFQRFEATVENNIAIEETLINEAQLVSAADKGIASHTISKLPQLYKTKLGHLLWRGEELSGGQWQQIGLSRAFYKNSQLIILDEPTSALDTFSEIQLLKNLKSISKDKIVILITHRLANLKIADKILVLHQGEIVETGNFSELISKENGYFANMHDKEFI